MIGKHVYLRTSLLVFAPIVLGAPTARWDNFSKIAFSNNVGHVKHYVRTPLRALVEERHFALVGGLRFPTWACF
jgi:hypothetical protein